MHRVKGKWPVNKAAGIFTICLLLILLLAACGPAEEEIATDPPIGSDGYPIDSSGYPTLDAVSENPAYPATSNVDESERFRIDQPVKAGATTVTGQGPKNLSIAIVNITLSGTILGTGTIGDDGRFSIPVSPLPEGYRIGLTVTDVEEGKTFEEVAVELYDYRGEGYTLVPSVGIFFDSALIEP